ncbi:hypothetical protein ACHWQZ_G000970 [Mnemiopsis leidyi]
MKAVIVGPPLNERNITLVKENSLDMQPIPVLRGDMTRSTVPTNTSTRQESPPNRVHKNNQGDSDARKSHSREAKPGNRTSAAPVQGPTVPYPHMSINEAITTNEGRDTKRSHIQPRGRTYSTSSAYRTRPTGFKNVPGSNPERNSEANISKIPTGARKSDNFGTERKSSTVGNETKRKCLLVHDDFLAEFDDTKFTSAVTVECFKVKSTSQLIRTGGLIAKLLEFRAKNTDLGDVMMVGDLNARTGSLNIGPVAEEDLEYAIPESHPETSERVRKDQIINSRGSKLIDFLACTKLSIMNGQTLGDIFGEFTSINYNGASVVDYMAASPEIRIT